MGSECRPYISLKEWAWVTGGFSITRRVRHPNYAHRCTVLPLLVKATPCYLKVTLPDWRGKRGQSWVGAGERTSVTNPRFGRSLSRRTTSCRCQSTHWPRSTPVIHHLPPSLSQLDTVLRALPLQQAHCVCTVCPLLFLRHRKKSGTSCACVYCQAELSLTLYHLYTVHLFQLQFMWCCRTVVGVRWWDGMRTQYSHLSWLLCDVCESWSITRARAEFVTTSVIRSAYDLASEALRIAEGIREKEPTLLHEVQRVIVDCMLLQAQVGAFACYVVQSVKAWCHTCIHLNTACNAYRTLQIPC